MKPLSKSVRINQALQRMQINNFFDVLYHLPRTYENFAPTRDTNLVHKERVVLVGQVSGPALYARHHRITMVTFPFTTIGHHFYRIVAYNRPYLMKQLTENEKYTLIGTYNRQKNEINLMNIVRGEMGPENQLKPVYSLPQDLANHEFIRLVAKAFTEVGGLLTSDLPASINRKYRFVDELSALKAVHHPLTLDDVTKGLRVLKYRECLLFSLKTQLIRAENQVLRKGKKAEIPLKDINPLILSLTYKLTEDQKLAVREIVLDMNKPSLMYRLLQGDVGTGKTLVAQLALYANYLRGDQGAMMVPTDALAQQHYRTFTKLFQGTPVKVGLLTGGLASDERAKIKDQLLAGNIDIIIGTHALFSADVFYRSLGLAVIDEQHRFGVNQRALLASKGERADLLLMSATPIPRTLALTLYGDLDVTTLSQFPRAVRDITTSIHSPDDKAVVENIRQTIVKNERVYIVAPLIDESESGRYSAEQLYAHYQKLFPQEIILLHGKMDNLQKAQALDNFASGRNPILISTTVIEVGIDVGEASLMIIYEATSFGLASLHQLRGRIGRLGQKARCMLLTDDQDEFVQEKLAVLVESNDGFKIAEADLRLRGPGEMSGLRQSGLPNFQYVNIISDFAMFEYARKDAIEILTNSEKLEYRPIMLTAKRQIRGEIFTNV